MNIVHIAPNATFDDGWGFQDNLLPKYHQKLGHNVTLLITNYIHDGHKKIQTRPSGFLSVDGYNVERLKYREYGSLKLTRFFCKLDVYSRLKELHPDVIFYHGLVSTTIFDVIRYKKSCKKENRACTIIQDNHLDYNIGVVPKNIKQKVFRTYYRIINKYSQKYVAKVYGVTPWREQYAQDYYQINPLLTDVLIMGADDEKIDFSRRESIRFNIRKKHGINENEFLIVSGGKLDEKKKVLELMEACSNMPKIKLLLFGSVADSILHKYEALKKNSNNIISIGWINGDEVYNYFFAADLIMFPGQHSVLWEQACATKTPCVFGRWPGMEHVNNGGNSDFIDSSDVTTIKNMIDQLVFTDKYCEMKRIANSEATDIYLYSEIAKKSLSGMIEYNV